MGEVTETHVLEYTDAAVQLLERHLEDNRRHIKRSLLDFIDYQHGLMPEEDRQRLENMFEILKRRVHNEMTMMEQSTLSGIRLFLSGGVIPPFGNPNWERRPQDQRHPKGWSVTQRDGAG